MKSNSRSIINSAFKIEDAEKFWNELESSLLPSLSEKVASFDAVAEPFMALAHFTDIKSDFRADIAAFYRELLVAETEKSNLLDKCMKYFESIFKFDSAGRPRIWTGMSQVDIIYDDALSKVWLNFNSNLGFLILQNSPLSLSKRSLFTLRLMS